MKISFTKKKKNIYQHYNIIYLYMKIFSLIYYKVFKKYIRVYTYLSIYIQSYFDINKNKNYLLILLEN